MSIKNLIVEEFVFSGHMRPPVVGSPDSGIWRRAITGAAPPTVQTDAAGLMKLSLTADSQVQNACLYFGDVLSYPIDLLVQVDFYAALTATFAAANIASFGVCSARADDPEATTAHAMFKCAGSNAAVISTDDNVRDTSNVATGYELGTTLRRFTMEFASGVQSRLGAPSLGGKANVLFSMDNDRGQLRRVGQAQLFDMSGYTGNLQPFAQIQKTSGTTTGVLSIQRITVTRKQN